MNGLSQQELLLLTGVWNAFFALATLGILWNARCRAVYLWFLSALGGAGFSLLMSLPSIETVYSIWWGQWLLGLTVIGSAWLKATAISVLARRERSLTPFYTAAAVLLAGIIIVPLLPIPRLWFSFYIACGVCVLMGVLANEAFRLGQSQNFLNAKILAVILGGQASFVLAAATAGAIAGVDPLARSAEPVSMLTVVLNFLAVLVNTSLFISLVLDLNLRQREEMRQRLTLAEVDRSRRDEREHMLADMHDGLGSQLATARLKLERGEMDQRELADLVTECMADMHLMVDTLRHQGETLSQALTDYRGRIERRLAGSRVRLVWRIKLDEAPSLAPKPLLQILRIVQESINNALKHAQPTEIVVSARYLSGSGYDIRIEDDGVGIFPETASGRGLDNLRRRAREVGATLSIERRGPGGGTRVALHLP